MLQVKDMVPSGDGVVASPASVSAKRAAMGQATHALHDEHDENHVYLRSTWIFAAWRRNQWRLLTSTLRLALCFFACATSPLLSSRQSPGHFPIYSDLLAIPFTDISIAKISLHISTILVILVFLRLVVYRLWLDRTWNWQCQFNTARQAFTRLSSASRIDHQNTQAHASTSVVVLKIYAAPASEQPHAIVRVHTQPQSQGSWTLVCLFTPFLWLVIVSILRPLVTDTPWDPFLFGRSSEAASIPQWRVQLTVFNTLLTLHSLSWLTVADEILQSLLVAKIGQVLRLILCWATTIILLVGVAHYDIFTTVLSNAVTDWSVQVAHSSALVTTLTNESWRCMLSGAVVALDLVWLLQDPSFPGFATTVGARLFGLPFPYLTLPLGRKLRIHWTCKWTQVVIVLGLLLPLDLCAFVQDLLYDPAEYSQVVRATAGYRVFPVNSTAAAEEPKIIHEMMTHGSLGRFVEQSLLDRLPSLVCVLLTVLLLLWMRSRERWRLSYTAFLGRPARALTAHKIETLNASVPPSTRELLKAQRRLYDLYRTRSQLDWLGACLALVAVGTVVLQIRSVWIWQGKAPGSSVAHTAGETFGFLLLLVSLATGYQLCHRYVVKYQILVLRQQLPPSPHSWWRSGAPATLLVVPFLVEVIVSVLCLPPFIHGDVKLEEHRFFLDTTRLPMIKTITCPVRMVPDTSDPGSCQLEYKYPVEVVNLVVFARLYWLVRLLRNEIFRRLFSDHATVLVAAGVGGTLPQDVSSLGWAFRMCLALIPGRTIAGIFVVLWLGTAATVSILERPYPSLLDHEEHSLWLAIVTISSVGYGDAYPLTAYGRLAIVLGAVFGGAFVVSLVTSIFLELLKSSKHEHKVVLTLERLAWEKQQRHASAQLIAAAWRYARVRRDGSNEKRTGSEAVLFELAHKYKTDRKQGARAREASPASIEQQQLQVISQWRTKHVTTWVQEQSTQRQALVGAIERAVDELERSLQSTLLVRSQ